MKKYRVNEKSSGRVTQIFPRCPQPINAQKHIYLIMLIVLRLNIQKYLMVTSDFCIDGNLLLGRKEDCKIN